jgi:DNA-binding NarL/FixJ family response regulator
MKKNILLVEDDDLLRMGLRTMIEMREEYCVQADAATGKEAIRFFERGSSLTLCSSTCDCRTFRASRCSST